MGKSVDVNTLKETVGEVLQVFVDMIHVSMDTKIAEDALNYGSTLRFFVSEEDSLVFFKTISETCRKKIEKGESDYLLLFSEVHVDMVDILMLSNRFEEALPYCDEGISYIIKNKGKERQALQLQLINLWAAKARIHFELEQPYMALMNYRYIERELRKPYVIEAVDDEVLWTVYYYYGMTLSVLEYYKKALGLFLKAVEVGKSMVGGMSNYFLAQSYHMLGLSYCKNEQPQKAIKAFIEGIFYAETLLERFEKPIYYEWVAENCFQISLLYFQEKKYDLVAENALRVIDSLQKREEDNPSMIHRLCEAYFLVAYGQEKMGDFHQALKFAKEGGELYEKESSPHKEDPVIYGQLLTVQASSLHQLQYSQEALPIIRKALDVFKDIELPKSIVDSAILLKETMEKELR